MITAVLLILEWAAKHVREAPAGSNAGEFVEAIQRWGGGKKGDSWCAFFVYFVGSIAAAVSGGNWPLPRTGSCEELHQYAITHHLIVEHPQKGDVYLLLDANGRAHHTGFVTDAVLEHFDETSGNTSDPTKAPSREGWGVFPHSRGYDAKQYRYIRWADAPTPLTAPT